MGDVCRRHLRRVDASDGRRTTTNPLMKRLETASHAVRGLLLVTNTPAGARAACERVLAQSDPNITVTSVRPLQVSVYSRKTICLAI